MNRWTLLVCSVILTVISIVTVAIMDSPKIERYKRDSPDTIMIDSLSIILGI